MTQAVFHLKKVVTGPLVVSLLRVSLGIVFIAASFDKIQDPEGFAQNIANYRLVPYPFIHIIAIVLPWLEITTGSLLVLGVWTRANAVLTAGLLMVFIAAISQALLRGLDISCGCFDTNPAADKMTRWTLCWNLIWLGWAVWVFFFDRGWYSIGDFAAKKYQRRRKHENP
ncbi:MAG: DoxX family membrane protein [Deltaproteobacteria bacterium]|nr:DoxX family membrane protein [Deltaproteobacteria bacterium]